jgi:predicted nucleic acid-binding protein
MIVADANLIAYLLIPGDKNDEADAMLARDPEWAVPLICRSEVRNILTLYMRRQQMSLSQALGTMEKAEALWRNREYSVPSGDVLELTSRFKVSAYDAEFVVLAKRLNCPLITYDGPLLQLFPDIARKPSSF